MSARPASMSRHTLRSLARFIRDGGLEQAIEPNIIFKKWRRYNIAESY